MDRVGADYFGAIEMMRERFTSVPVAIQIPAGSEDSFRGAIDLINWKMLIWDEATQGLEFSMLEIPEEFVVEATLKREKMIENLADVDDELADKYLDGEEITIAEIKRALRKATISLKIAPVLCGAALRNKGIQPLLDAVLDYLPSPEDIPPVKGINPVTKKKKSDLVPTKNLWRRWRLKFMIDEGRKLSYLRIYSGKLHANDEIYNSIKKKKRKNRPPVTDACQ